MQHQETQRQTGITYEQGSPQAYLPYIKDTFDKIQRILCGKK